MLRFLAARWLFRLYCTHLEVILDSILLEEIQMMCWKKTAWVLAVLALAALLGCGSDGERDSEGTGLSGPYDLIITNGQVMDPQTGLNEPATVGVRNGVIGAIATGSDVDLPRTESATIIDAAGRIVAPGFINTHTHEGNVFAISQVDESSRAYVQDGITFWLGGNCGLSPTGVKLKFGDIWIDNRRKLTLPQFLDQAEREGLYNHYGTLTGNLTLRGDVGCEHGQEESGDQIEQMVAILAGDLAAGSFGISYGPFYDPGTTKAAMIELARKSRSSGGMAAIHTRNPTFNLWNVLFPNSGPGGPDIILFKENLTEAVDICREAGVPLLVSHLTDMAYNHSTKWCLDTIEQAVLWEHLPLAADVIGYDTFMNDLFALTRFGEIPVELLMLFAGVAPEQFWMAEDVYVDEQIYLEAYERFRDMDQVQSLVQAFEEDRARAGKDSTSLSVGIWCNIVAPESTMLALQRPFVFMGNDGGVSRNPPKTGQISVQPRSYACFSRLLGRWSRQNHAISLEQALFKATIAPALWLGLDRKGRLQKGCDADIVIFDPETILDRALPEPGSLALPPEGIDYVIVSGQVVVDHGQLTGVTPGKVIRRTWKIRGNTEAVLTQYDQRFPF